MSHLSSLPWESWHSLTLVRGLLVTGGDSGVSTELFLFAVGGLAGTVATMAAIIQRIYVNRIKQLEEDIAEKQKRLDAYATLAPDIVTEVRTLLNAAKAPPASSDSQPSSTLPYPYGTSRTTHRPRRGTGGRS